MQQLLSNLTSALGRANATARGLAANATQSAQGTLQNVLLNSLGSQALSTRIDLGAALDPINAAGVTPLYLAITEGNVESCKVLLASGADPNSKNAKGQTALQVIVFILFENSEIVSMYIP